MTITFTLTAARDGIDIVRTLSSAGSAVMVRNYYHDRGFEVTIDPPVVLVHNVGVVVETLAAQAQLDMATEVEANDEARADYDALENVRHATYDDLQNRDIVTLRKRAAGLRIKGCWAMSKQKLVAAIMEVSFS